VNGQTSSLFSSPNKGVMVPVVLADITLDGQEDILLTSFGGVLIAFDGRTFSRIWRQNYQNYETYT